MKKILKLLDKLCTGTGNNISIRIFSDGSGFVVADFDENIYSFESLKQLKQYLKND
jgi:hypothetical protein